MAFSLKQMGIKRGDLILLYMPNCVEAIITMFALARIGAMWHQC
jgi:acyl-coenzyme A synthetase/AMP-(fatty) acid ligase